MENRTPLSAAYMPWMTLGNDDVAAVVMSGTYALPAPGSKGSCELSAVQLPVPLADEYNGESGASSLQWEGQAGAGRPGTDICVSGAACAVAEKPTTQLTVGVRVGSREHTALVFGERWWRRGPTGMQPSAAKPFIRLPLVYENAFGGRFDGMPESDYGASDHNPVGRGLHPEAINQPLPNIENPSALIERLDDRPLPQGFGPIARYWRPRRDLAGTYDEEWVSEHVPLWPSDVQPEFLFAAPPGLRVAPHLQGGEPVVIVGMHPSGTMQFALPAVRPVVRFRCGNRVQRQCLRLEAILLEPTDLRMRLIWRAQTRMAPSELTRASLSLRLLEPWEVSPQ
jgi:hypothetical protein